MIEYLNRLGEKLSSWLGSPQLEAESLKNQESLHDNIFSFDSLSSMLFFESVEIAEDPGKDHTFFVSKGSVGFVIESSPIVGGGNDTHRTILELIDELLEEGVSIQGLLLADHKINDYLKSHAEERAQHGELFFEMIRQRSLHFRDLTSNSARNFRFIFSLSMPGEPSGDLYTKLIEKKKRALKTLQDLSPSFSWDENEFLTTVSALINFSQSTIPDTRKLNPLESFSSQLPKGGVLAVTEEGLVWEKKHPVRLKTYRAVDFPDYWSINSMNKLIGSFEKDRFRINAPFYIHYGIYCPPQASIERSYSIRSNVIDKQARSPFLCRVIPELGEEHKEIDHIRHARKKGDTFVCTQLSTGFWSQENQSETIEQTMKSLWKMHDFELRENRYIHLPSYLSIFPMAWGECASDLRVSGVLRTTVSSESPNFFPIQGEWKGTPRPGVLLMGRRGQICNFNLFDGGTNYNAVVVGESGSGKSVFLQEILMNNLGTGGKVYVLDVGGSFLKQRKKSDPKTNKKTVREKTQKSSVHRLTRNPHLFHTYHRPLNHS